MRMGMMKSVTHTHTARIDRFHCHRFFSKFDGRQVSFVRFPFFGRSVSRSPVHDAPSPTSHES